MQPVANILSTAALEAKADHLGCDPGFTTHRMWDLGQFTPPSVPQSPHL